MRYRPRENQKKDKKIIINVSEDDHRLIKMTAANYGYTISRLIIKALKFYMNEKLN